jgi:hypothetical protein
MASGILGGKTAASAQTRDSVDTMTCRMAFHVDRVTLCERKVLVLYLSSPFIDTWHFGFALSTS